MNQLCRVCGESAAGYHFGAFTCEGCKSFFGRTYNNVSSLGDCKNGGRCIINRKNRTSCKVCRLRKCLRVGMSKSGSRYGRRSNWFKIHCLFQDQVANVADSSGDKKFSGPLGEVRKVLTSLEKSRLNKDVQESQEERSVKEESQTRFSPSPSRSESEVSREATPTPQSSLYISRIVPPEAHPLFAALSPFLIGNGLPLHQTSLPFSQIPHLPAFYSMLTASSLGSMADRVTSSPTPSHTVILPDSHSPDQRLRSNPAISLRSAQRESNLLTDPSAFTPVKASPLEKSHLSQASSNLTSFHVLKGSNPRSAIREESDSNRHVSLQDSTELIKKFQNASPVESVSKMADSKSRLVPIHLNAIATEEALNLSNRCKQPYEVTCLSRTEDSFEPGLRMDVEQDEPIDLSIKSTIKVSPQRESPPFLSCCMTLTAIDDNVVLSSGKCSDNLNEPCCSSSQNENIVSGEAPAVLDLSCNA